MSGSIPRPKMGAIQRRVKSILMLIHGHRLLMTILVISLVIRVGFFIALQPWDAGSPDSGVQLRNDALEYHEMGLALRHHLDFGSITPIRTPGYPVFLAGTYLVSGDSVWFALLLQAFLDAALVLVVYATTLVLFQRVGIALLAALLYALSFISAYWAGQLFTETVFTFVLALGFLVYWSAVKQQRSWRWFVIVGFLVGMATLVRPIALFVPVFMVIGIVASGTNRRKALLMSGALIGAAFLTLMPWHLRNVVEYGHYSLSTVGDFNLFHQHAGRTYALSNGVSREQAREELGASELNRISNPFDRGIEQRKRALEYIGDHPSDFFRYYIRGTAYMYAQTAKSEVLEQFLGRDFALEEPEYKLSESLTSRISREIKNAPRELFVGPILAAKMLLVYLGLVIGWIVLAKRRDLLPPMMILLIVVWFTLPVGVLGEERFRLPLVPLYLPVAAYGMMAVWTWVSARRAEKAQ